MEKILNQLLESQKEIIKRLDGIKAKQKEQGEILQAVRHTQEAQKAEIDRLNHTTAHIQGEQADIKEIFDNMAGDVSFLVRKAAKMTIFAN